MPDFADFARLHPDIEMEILSSGELANLTNREADVAIRVVYDRKTLPLNLHGLKGPELFGGVYMSRDRLAAWRAGAPDPIRWIVISIMAFRIGPARVRFAPRGFPSGSRTPQAQIVAVRQGLGITTLPCFVGDADPLLVRVPGTDLHMYGTLWLLTQGRHARRSACGSSRSSYPAGWPHTVRFSRGCQYRGTDDRQVAFDGQVLEADIPKAREGRKRHERGSRKGPRG
jgi:DNA-binding transcriptional LysR family regulator